MQVEAEGDVATAVTLARILSNIPLSRGGPTSVVIFDIHALQASHFHVKSVIISNAGRKHPLHHWPNVQARWYTH